MDSSGTKKIFTMLDSGDFNMKFKRLYESEDWDVTKESSYEDDIRPENLYNIMNRIKQLFKDAWKEQLEGTGQDDHIKEGIKYIDDAQDINELLDILKYNMEIPIKSSLWLIADLFKDVFPKRLFKLENESKLMTAVILYLEKYLNTKISFSVETGDL